MLHYNVIWMKSFCKGKQALVIECNGVSITEIQVKELDKRASGQAFEVILSPSAPDVKGEFPLSTPKKKEVSLDEIQKKLEAAEERRKVSGRLGINCMVIVFSVPHLFMFSY